LIEVKLEIIGLLLRGVDKESSKEEWLSLSQVQ
jgi:hypothetical protein